MSMRFIFIGIICLSLGFSDVVFSQNHSAVHQYEVDPADSGDAKPPLAEKQSKQEALAQDLKLVAEAKGWTIEEAVADRRAADAVGAIAVKLARERPDIFVGSVLSKIPGGTPSLYIKGAAGKEVYDLVYSQKLDIDIVDGQPYSFNELEKRKLQVHNILEEQGFKNIATSFDIQADGMINAAVTQQLGLPERTDELRLMLPESLRESVNITISTEPVAEDFYAFGGMAVKDDGVFECTSGWSVENGAGTTGVTTAGHCTGINQIHHPGIGDHSMTHQSQHRGQWGDIEWKTTVAIESAEFYANAYYTRDVTSIEPRASISVGESICFYGRASNNRDCSLDVSATSVSCTVSGVFNDRLVRMDGNSAIPGDSGGGWSWNFRAYGSVKGICGGGAVFSVADLYDEALGVTVRTH